MKTKRERKVLLLEHADLVVKNIKQKKREKKKFVHQQKVKEKIFFFFENPSKERFNKKVY